MDCHGILTNIHSPQRVNLNDFGDALTSSSATNRLKFVVQRELLYRLMCSLLQTFMVVVNFGDPLTYLMPFYS